MKYHILFMFMFSALAGCDSAGQYLATILPEKAISSSLDESQDGQFVDPTQIGEAEQQYAGKMPIGNPAFSNHGDPTANSEYAQMTAGMEEPNMDPGQQIGAFVGEGEYSKAMTLDANDLNEGSNDPTSEYQGQFGEFELPDTINGSDPTQQYMEAGGIKVPAADIGGNQDPTAQYLGNGVTQSPNSVNTGQNQTKPNPEGAPQKKNIPSTIRPKNSNTRTPNPKSEQANNPPKPPDKIQVRVPGNVNPGYATFDAPVTVPLLLERGTSMSFAANLQQTRPLPAEGTVYWVIHSERHGFSRFALPSPNGTLPERLQGVVAQFTPTSGPFRMFLILVTRDNKVIYLTSAKDVRRNS